MTWIISKNGVVKCVTTVPYSPAILKNMRQAGYKIIVKE